MDIEMMKLHQQALRVLSTSDLRAALKEDLEPEVHDMIIKELFEIRETT